MIPTTHLPAPATQAGHLSHVYLAAWGILATLALAYLAVLALRPDLADLLISGPGQSAPEGNRGQRATAKALAEVDELRRAFTGLQRELQELREATAARDLREQALAARVAALEAAARLAARDAVAQRADGTTAVAEAGVAAPPAGKPAALAGAAVEGTVQDGPSRPVRQAGAAGPAIAAPPQRAAPAVGIQIATGPSLDALRLSWLLLQENHRAILRSLEPRWLEAPGDPSGYNLVVGPMADHETAGRACERLKLRRIPCTVTPYSGRPL